MRSQLQSYTEALIPTPYTILGIPLRPLSLGHIFLMKRFDCKFASENPDEKGGIDDLLLGIAICSREFDEFLEFIQNPKEFHAWAKKWGKLLHKQLKKKNEFELVSKFYLFKEYLKDGIFIPKYWEMDNNEDSMSSGTHWTQTVLHALMSELGYSQKEALNIPISRALADYFRHLERNGLITLMTDDELNLIEEKG
jgi:hypothetical protein